MQTSVPQTEEEIIAWLNARGNGDPDENGISRDQLRENRLLTPRERLEELERCVSGLMRLQERIKVNRHA
ncbi:hypothetical protein [Armatimonas sp.]|uniref:hypothetical protein n=1 Tax=Armatimonas sp. TaxID=1872638 RepID=UPI00286CED3F|nr:hypothetical protein [Armatimonas sp.]